MKLFVGALLTTMGLVVIYESISLRLIDLILFLGLLMAVIGIILLISVFIYNIYGYNISISKDISNFVDYKPINNRQISSNIKDSVLGSSGIYSYESPVLVSRGGREKKSSASFFGPSLKNKESKNKYSKFNKYDLRNSKFDSSNLKNNGSGLSNQRLLNSKNYGSNMNKSKSSIFGFNNESNFNKSSKREDFVPENKNHVLKVREDYDENKVVPSIRDLNFTPNYDKPMKITRRPRKKSIDKIDINNIPKRSINNAKSILNDEFLNLEELNSPKHKTYEEVAEEVIVPIHSLDESDVIVPIHKEYDSNNINLAYASYDYENDSLDYDYSSSVQEPIHVVEVYDEFESVSETVLNTNSDDESSNEVPYDKEFVIDDLDDEDNNFNSPNIINPLNNLDSEVKPIVSSNLDTNLENKQIQIDPNNPDSLPIPKLLNSYVICEKGILTSKDAFEEVATHAKSEILLEAPDIRDMGDVFLSALSKVNSRIILQEFDTNDLSYVLLISSLLSFGIKIKTAPIVESFNLIGDLSHALIISNDDEEKIEYGAVYDDEESVRGIKELFEDSWSLANDLNIPS